MDAALLSGLDPEAFPAWERQQPARHVYFRGEVFARAGGSPRHSRLASRLIARFDASLAGRPCDVHTSDLRLGLDDTHFAYADVVIVCRPVSLRARSSDVVTNPRVVVEVLSSSTERYDRGDKQAAFLALNSIEHSVLVSQRQKRVELYTREPSGGFHFQVLVSGDCIELESLDIRLPVDELYDGVFELPGDEPVGA